MDKIICRKEGCKNKSLSLTDYCSAHLVDLQPYIKMLEEWNYQKKSMKGFNLKGLIAPNINLAGADLEAADLNHSRLKGADFSGSNLAKCDFVGADLSNASMIGTNANNSYFMQANLTKASALNVNFEGANLSEANLSTANFLNANLFKANLYHANLSEVKFLTKENFFKFKNKFIIKEGVDESGIRSAKESYIGLKQYFLINGRFDDLSWASYKENLMEVKRLWQEKQISFFPFFIMGILCGWGERPFRAVISSLMIIIGFGIAYFLSDSIIYNGFNAASIDYKLKFLDYIYYSTVTFTTVGYGDFIPKVNIFYRILAGGEAFIGIFMMGLFIFTLGRRFSSR